MLERNCRFRIFIVNDETWKEHNKVGIAAINEPQLIGIFKATSTPYFDNSPLFPSAIHVSKDLPFRVEFEQLYNLLSPINIDEIWELKEKGKIWTLQQTRGDAVGVLEGGIYGL